MCDGDDEGNISREFGSLQGKQRKVVLTISYRRRGGGFSRGDDYDSDQNDYVDGLDIENDDDNRAQEELLGGMIGGSRRREEVEREHYRLNKR